VKTKILTGFYLITSGSQPKIITHPAPTLKFDSHLVVVHLFTNGTLVIILTVGSQSRCGAMIILLPPALSPAIIAYIKTSNWHGR